MKKIKAILLLLVVALSSCGNEKDNVPEESATRIVATYINSDGEKKVAIMLRMIEVTTKYDSTKSKRYYSVDTLWGFPITVPLRDSLGNIVKDSLGNEMADPRPAYLRISKDSVNWRIENIPVDELLK